MMLTTHRRGQFFIVSCVLVIMSLHMIGMYITQRHVPMGDISIGQLNEFENLLSAVDTVDTLSDDFSRERNMRALDILFQASLKTEAMDWEGQVRYVSDWSFRDRYLFSLGTSYRSHLEKDTVDTDLRTGFKNNGVTLRSDAGITPAGEKRWLVRSGSTSYGVEDVNTKLDVYKVTNYRYPVHLTSTYDVEDTVVTAHLEIPLNSSREIIVKEKGSDDALDDVQMTFQFHLKRLYADVNWTALGETKAFQTRTFYVYLDVSEPDD